MQESPYVATLGFYLCMQPDLSISLICLRVSIPHLQAGYTLQESLLGEGME